MQTGDGPPANVTVVKTEAETSLKPVGPVEPSFEGKPQCQIIPIAKEHGDVAVSVGCMLSRVRTGLSNNEMTCAVPTGLLPSLIDGLQKATAADRAVAAYAANDTGRFS